MGAFKYVLPSDLVSPTSVTVTSGSVDATYGTSYLTDFSDANILAPMKATSAAITLVMDFGVATTIAAFLIWSDIDAGHVITIDQNATNSWGAPSYTGTFTALAKRGDGFCRQLWATIGQTYRYTRFTFPANSVNPGIKIQAIQTARSLTGFGIGYVGRQFNTNYKDLSIRQEIVHTTASGHRWGYDLGRGSRARTEQLTYANTDADAIRTWFELTGRTRVMPFLPDDSLTEGQLIRLGASGESLSGASLNTFTDEIPENRVNRLQVAIEQITAGEPEWT